MFANIKSFLSLREEDEDAASQSQLQIERLLSLSLTS